MCFTWGNNITKSITAEEFPNRSLLVESREIETLLGSLRREAYFEILEGVFRRKHAEDPYLFHFVLGGINSILF